ncbi:hypothetical protein LSH36_564g01052 [Paralvinella palmiformis]|uniref:Hypoxia up-regulated protein 1 n=1 Tax=Paralvinella palmiformis TaxID=53620 RepID=A0AAD9J671_9ANNE|nr:hypothetical protein LSH36_564g01052 [Paralvinella palmiformis]
MEYILLLTAVAAVLTSAAGLAVMSVDFGSEFMKIAIVKPGVPMEIALNKESRRKTPVVVSIKDGERLFSDPAMNVALKYPRYAFKDLIDLLGKKASNPIISEYKKRYPFYDIEADPDTGLVAFKLEDGMLYSAEELVAMILESAKVIASDFAEQPITEAVITVPVYFNQAERRAIMRAGELAGLKVLQLINDNTAVALNYGVFRRKEFNNTAANYIFFDMGSSKTTVTLVAYQLVKAKNAVTGIEETFPQLTIKGVGFDRTLGGKIFQSRLANHLAKEFTKMKKTPNSVYDSPRALQKLHKEAGRLKNVLSANTEHFAQIEGLLDDKDFRVKVTREQFEEICSDLFQRVNNVIADALKSSEVTLDEVSDVILMGGGTRVPKVQEMIRDAVNRKELGKSINTDEAAALGASYQAAHLSKGYKVKKFAIKDANLFPIQVEFERARSGDDNGDSSKLVKRLLFGRMNPFPQKKVMTFSKQNKDFSFAVNYGDLSFLNEEFLKGFGKLTLQEVALVGIEDAFVKHSKDGEPKGTKAHFRIDDSGLFVVDKVETLFEKLVEEEVKKEESTLSKIGNTISSFFGGGGSTKDQEEKQGSVEDTKNETNPDQQDEAQKTDTDSKKQKKMDGADENTDREKSTEQNDKEQSSSGDNEAVKSKSDSSRTDENKETDTEPKKDEEQGDGKKDDGSKKEDGDDKTTQDDKKDKEDEKGDKKEENKTEKKTKPVAIKEEIQSHVLMIDLSDPSLEKINASKKKISDLRKKDMEKIKLAKVKNELESFIFDTQDKLYQEIYEKCSTDEEREKIRTKFSEVSDWLYEQEEDAERKVYDIKLSELKKLTADLYQRVYEAEERPKAIEALNGVVNYTEYFRDGMKNLTGEDQPFTEVELATLEKLINTTKNVSTKWKRVESLVLVHRFGIKRRKKNKPGAGRPKKTDRLKDFVKPLCSSRVWHSSTAYHRNRDVQSNFNCRVTGVVPSCQVCIHHHSCRKSFSSISDGLKQKLVYGTAYEALVEAHQNVRCVHQEIYGEINGPVLFRED